jgi:5'-nucleotidase
MPKGVCLNVNIPKLQLNQIKGIKVVRQANAIWYERFDERQDPYGRNYYWLTGEFINHEKDATDTDEWALNNNYISVVPVHTDLTAHFALQQLKSMENEFKN